MDDHDWLARRFEDNRTHLRSVAFRILGSASDAEDAVQEAWLRLSRSDTSDVQNLGGWLTTVVARVSLNMLRTRTSRREDPQGVRLPDGIAGRADRAHPEDEALLADSVGPALLLVLDTLDPRSGSRSCCTTCSPFPSTRSPASWTVRPQRPASSPAAPGAGCRELTPLAAGTVFVSERSSRLSSPPPATVGSTLCSRCSTHMWCCGPTT